MKRANQRNRTVHDVPGGNQRMASYQIGLPGTKPGQTWSEAQPFYIFKNQ